MALKYVKLCANVHVCSSHWAERALTWLVDPAVATGIISMFRLLIWESEGEAAQEHLRAHLSLKQH